MNMDFKLSENFLSLYKDKEPNWGPMGEFVYLRTYSRRIEDENRNERWWETVRRVIEGTYSIQKEHCTALRLVWDTSKAHRSAEKMYDKIFNFKFLPPGRGLWMMGTDFVKNKGSAALVNCSFISSEDIDVRGSFIYTWIMDALMLGVGAGLDTKGAGKILVKEPKKDGVFVIEDCRESWVESLGILLDAFFHGKRLPTFDYSKIRPYGTPIKGFGGTASGPEPLKKMHENLVELLSSRIGQRLSSVDLVDIENIISVCVIAGNVRRSAAVCIGNAEDKEYVTMKDFNLHPKELQDHRWSSNNSVFAKVGETDYSQFVDSLALNGEPGIVWLENMQKYSRTISLPDWKDYDAKGPNACGEITLCSTEICNLCETFPSLHDSYAEYKETLKYAYLYAKTVTLVPTHWPETNAIILKNRRIGLSQSGIIDAFVKHGRRTMLQWSNDGYSYVEELDKIYSDWLCIPRSRKMTTVKPSGTVSILPGVSPGIHYPHAQYYIRRVRLAKDSPLVSIMIRAGYHVEDDVTSTDTKVVSFPIYEPLFDKKKADVSMWEQIKNVVDYQRFWADNNVSVTITFKPEEKNDIVRVLECYEDSLKTISFLPIKNHGYKQAPYEEIDKTTYETMLSKISKVDFSGLNTIPIGSKMCDGDSCTLG
jgi:adenosylcobalamin-dependent ribonucleoside-triphosphate reductase